MKEGKGKPPDKRIDYSTKPVKTKKPPPTKGDSVRLPVPSPM